MTSEQKQKADKINWWHTIKLSDDYTTKGRVGLDHCSPEAITKRFGMPEDLRSKTVLDVGGFDGLFSFEAEKRGAASVYMIDCYQGEGESMDGFMLAREVLNSKVKFDHAALEDLKFTGETFDIVCYYGVLYHTDSPIDQLKMLYKLCGDTLLIETAILQEAYNEEIDQEPLWGFYYGRENDYTNKFYPNRKGLWEVLRYVGFKSMELIWEDGVRMTVMASKKAPF